MGANLKEVRERITSVDSTMQITKAMKMVSAAKLRRAQEAISELRPYAVKLQEILSNILTNLGDEAEVSFGKEREVNKACLVVITSSRGLCGAFNSNILKEATNYINANKELVDRDGLVILPIGKKSFDYFSKRYPSIKLLDKYVNLFEDLAFDNVAKIPNKLMGYFEDKKLDKIDVVYGHFRNAALQFPTVEAFLPVPKMEAKEGESQSKADYIFEPDQNVLLEQLVPTILQTKFQKCVLDTHASEHGARMTAMDNATNNAEELKKELKIAYNKARQEAITKEISEIVGGAAALNG